MQHGGRLCKAAGGSLERYVHHRITPGCLRVHRSHNSINVQVHGGPLGIAQHDHGNPAAFEVLLVLDIFVGSQQDIEPALFRRLQQFAVG